MGHKIYTIKYKLFKQIVINCLFTVLPLIMLILAGNVSIAAPLSEASPIGLAINTKVQEILDAADCEGEVIDVNPLIGVVVKITKMRTGLEPPWIAGQIGHILYHDAEAVAKDFKIDILIHFTDKATGKKKIVTKKYFEIEAARADKLVHELDRISDKDTWKARVLQFLKENLKDSRL